ncbi:MAG: hypothetical protein R3F11_14945 [Verrucomicrobiales bacterium]
MAAFVEIKAAPGGSLGGLLLAVFDAAGALVSAHDLDRQSASASGYFVVSAAAIPGWTPGWSPPGCRCRPPGGRPLPGGCRAGRRVDPDRLIDAIPYGATGASGECGTRRAGLGRVLSGKGSAPAVAGAFPSLGRTAVPPPPPTCANPRSGRHAVATPRLSKRAFQLTSAGRSPAGLPPNGLGDLDGDRVSDLLEFIFGTLPGDATSGLGSFAVSFAGGLRPSRSRSPRSPRQIPGS